MTLLLPGSLKTDEHGNTWEFQSSGKMIDANGSVLTPNIGHVAIHLGRLKHPKGEFTWKAPEELVAYQLEGVPVTFVGLPVVVDDSVPSDELHLCVIDSDPASRMISLVGKIYNLAPRSK
jgi:hypothetical protein